MRSTVNSYNIIKFRQLKDEIEEVVKYLEINTTSNVEAGLYYRMLTEKIYKTKLFVNNEYTYIGNILGFKETGQLKFVPDYILIKDECFSNSAQLNKLFNEYIHGESIINSFMIGLLEYKSELAKSMVEILIAIINFVVKLDKKNEVSLVDKKVIKSLTSDNLKEDISNKISSQNKVENIKIRVKVSAKNPAIIELVLPNNIMSIYTNLDQKPITGCGIIKFIENLEICYINEFTSANHKMLVNSVNRNDSIGITIKGCSKLIISLNNRM